MGARPVDRITSEQVRECGGGGPTRGCDLDCGCFFCCLAYQMDADAARLKALEAERDEARATLAQREETIRRMDAEDMEARVLAAQREQAMFECAQANRRIADAVEQRVKEKDATIQQLEKQNQAAIVELDAARRISEALRQRAETAETNFKAERERWREQKDAREFAEARIEELTSKQNGCCFCEQAEADLATVRAESPRTGSSQPRS